ncbi:DUF881 domain-containing protein [Cellulomonas sp. ICMP 17802]|uniref:DUF881 domain-containing protein n=1 Tax=Cellulomonas sp. ICMP 17802 TaxID=3239199 RepID=UPI00351B6AEF
MTVTPSQEERDEPVEGGREPAEDALSLPPVVPEDEQLSLPPVVPENEPLSLPPVVPDDEELSVPPVVPEGEQLSLPPVVPEDEQLRLPAAAAQDETSGGTPDLADTGAGSVDETTVASAAEPPAPADGRAGPAEEPSGWTVLGRALRPRLTRAQLLAGLLCAVLGFALVAQVRQSGGADLAGMRQGDLVRILDETTNRGDALARESADLARERDDLLSGSDRRQAALDALRRSAETQGILTGRLPAQGPGVVVTLTEPDGYIKPITMLNLLEELRNAGAEAVQLNDQRVTASSAFTGTGGAVVLDGVALTAPYRWIAIGDPDIISPALQIPGGAMAQVRNNGGRGTVESVDEVQVDAIRDLPDPVYATPVPPTGD